MAEPGFQLRTYAFIDAMQPQYAAFLGSELDGSVPQAGMAELWLELSPGSEIYSLLDTALKATDARLGLQKVEREFGILELHARSVETVKQAGWSILNRCGLSAKDRLAPQIVSTQIIHKIDPYQAQQVNKVRKGTLLLPGRSLLVIEMEPATSIVLASYGIEKAADIELIHFNPFGRYGRLLIAGSESEVTTALAAANAAVEKS